MIKNVPSHLQMTETALRLYFLAWDQVADILIGVHESPSIAVEIRDRNLLPVADESEHIALEDSQDALRDFLRRTQSDMQLAYTLILQSQEIGLKAKLCAISPYLLLLGTDVKSWAKANADFMDFRTLDASDLIRVVNVTFSKPMSEQFCSNFDKLRRGRNKISHLGVSNEILEPLAIIDILVSQYLEMYEGRSWLQDRVRMLSLSSDHHFYDKRYNEKTAVYEQIAAMEFYLTDNQRRRLLGLPLGERLFHCPPCYHASRADYICNEVLTAYVAKSENSGENRLFCRLCGRDYCILIDEEVCGECGCNVVLGDHDFQSVCCACGFDLAEPVQ